LICYNIKSKTKIIKKNDVWKYNKYTSYCLYETNDDCLIYRVGGQDNKKIPNIKYSMKSDIWNELPFTQTQICGTSTVYNKIHGLITIGGIVYNNNWESVSTVEILNDKNTKWKYLSSMNYKRGECSAISIENKLFVFGGYNSNDDKYLNSTEMFDFNNNDNNNSMLNNLKWKNLKNMKHEKSNIGIKYFENKNEILLIGGYNNINKEVA